MGNLGLNPGAFSEKQANVGVHPFTIIRERK